MVVDGERPAGRGADQPARLQDGARLLRERWSRTPARRTLRTRASTNVSLQYQAGKVAMWYDATVAAGLLEAANSPVKGKNGYAFAPSTRRRRRDGSGRGRLRSRRARPTRPTPGSTSRGRRARSTSRPPARTRRADGRRSRPGRGFSTYEIPQYKTAAKAFASITLAAMKAAPITNPGTTKRPGLPGVQYVGIPQFQDVGNRCTQLFSSVIAGSMKDTDAHQSVSANRVTGDQVALP